MNDNFEANFLTGVAYLLAGALAACWFIQTIWLCWHLSVIVLAPIFTPNVRRLISDDSGCILFEVRA